MKTIEINGAADTFVNRLLSLPAKGVIIGLAVLTALGLVILLAVSGDQDDGYYMPVLHPAFVMNDGGVEKCLDDYCAGGRPQAPGEIPVTFITVEPVGFLAYDVMKNEVTASASLFRTERAWEQVDDSTSQVTIWVPEAFYRNGWLICKDAGSENECIALKSGQYEYSLPPAMAD